MRRAAIWAARVGVAVLVAVLFANGDSGVPTPPPWDKVAHFGYFGLLTGLLWLASAGRLRWPVLLLGAGVLGVADEWRQVYLPHRQASVADLAADLAGALTALAGLTAGTRRRQRRRAFPDNV